MYEKLIEQLRTEPLDTNKAVLSIYDLCVDAASAIESQKETIRLAEETMTAQGRAYADLAERFTKMEEEKARLQNGLKQVKAERDAAVADLKALSDDTGDGCHLCRNMPCAPKNGKCIGWEWRGPQKE